MFSVKDFNIMKLLAKDKVGNTMIKKSHKVKLHVKLDKIS